MKLRGALRRWFSRRSRVVLTAIVAIVVFFVDGYLAENFVNYSFVGVQDALLVAPILIAVGAVLAALSASVAIRRYLKA